MLGFSEMRGRATAFAYEWCAGSFDKNAFYGLVAGAREDGSDLAETLDGLFARGARPGSGG